jgi:RHS repeat-associated protein
LLFENFIFSRTSLLTLQSDHDLNLYYNRARYLDVNRGRFWSQDSFEGINEEPGSLHKYSYTHSDPVNNVDPSGKSKTGVVLIAGLVLVAIVTYYFRYDLPRIIYGVDARDLTPQEKNKLRTSINELKDCLQKTDFEANVKKCCESSQPDLEITQFLKDLPNDIESMINSNIFKIDSRLPRMEKGKETIGITYNPNAVYLHSNFTAALALHEYYHWKRQKLHGVKYDKSFSDDESTPPETVSGCIIRTCAVARMKR